MAKAGILLVAFFALWSGATFQRGCKDLGNSLTHLTYFDKRDMRSTIVIVPQKRYLMGPDSLSVPTTGRERWNAANEQAERDRLNLTFVVPTAADPASIARGELKYKQTCVPCHGLSMKGDGPVAAKFLPPPDLLKENTRLRSDGFIYGYIRHGGAVMPSYGAQVSAQEAYDLIHYLRHMQQTQPR